MARQEILGTAVTGLKNLSDKSGESSEEEYVITHRVDARGERCPMPLLKAKQALKKMAVGEVLEVTSTDPSALEDFKAMLRHLPHQLLAHTLISEQPRQDMFLILKAE